MVSDEMICGERIKRLREEKISKITGKPVTQEELGTVINKSVPTVSKIEAGIIEPDLETLNKLADFLDTTVDFILGRTSERYLKVYNDKEFPEGTLEENSEIHLFKDALKNGLTVEDIKEAIEFMKKLKS
jgi:transcriptional regulator with XRE-family HTH domain